MKTGRKKGRRAERTEGRYNDAKRIQRKESGVVRGEAGWVGGGGGSEL
jgi:hypothetical protein